MLYAYKICLLTFRVSELPPDTIVTQQQITKGNLYTFSDLFIACGGFLVVLV